VLHLKCEIPNSKFAAHPAPEARHNLAQAGRPGKKRQREAPPLAQSHPREPVEFSLRAANFVHHKARKSSSRTNCPHPAHPASRIFLDDRVTLIHGARRQIETQNRKQNPPRTPPPPRHPNPCPSPLTLLTSPKMTINLAPSRPSPLLSHNGSGSRKPRCCVIFLIANARLRLRPSHRKLSPLKFPNRERMTIHRRVHSLLHSFEPQPASFQKPWPPYHGRLIANLELNLSLTSRRTNYIQFSNRKFLSFFALNFSVSTAIACSSTQVVLIYGSAIKTPRNTLKRCGIKISNRR
jgi:hypothetical protein